MFEWIKNSPLGELFLSLNSQTLAEFHFLRPVWLWAIPLAAILAWAVARHVNAQGRWQKLLDPQLLSALTLSGDTGNLGKPSSRRWLTSLLALAWVLGSLAMAGPVWEKQAQPVYKAPESRVVILDLSPSMQTTDLAPTRLKRAKFKLRDLLKLDQQQDRDQRTGLVVFAGDAHIVVPLTDDKATIEAMLPALAIDIMPLPGNRLAPALQLASELLDGVKAQHGQILLLSDGIADTASALKWANNLRQKGHRLDVISVGGAEPSAPLSRADGSLLRDRNHQLLSAKVDRNSLAALANAAGGKHLRLRSDDNDLLALSKRGDWQQRLQQHQQHADTRSVQRWQEQGPWLLIPLLLVAALLARKGWLLALVLIIQIPSPPTATAADTAANPIANSAPSNNDISNTTMPTHDSDSESPWKSGWKSGWQTRLQSHWNDLWQRPDQQAAKQLQAGDAAAAAQRFDNPRWKAAAQYKAGNYQAAEQTLQGYDDARAHYNRGNALAHSGKLKEALASFEEALKKNPDDKDALANRDLVKSLLRKQQQKQDQQQNKQQKDQKQKQSDNDQQKSDNNQSDQKQSKTGKPKDGQSNNAPANNNSNPANDRPESAQPSKPNDKDQTPNQDQPSQQDSKTPKDMAKNQPKPQSKDQSADTPATSPKPKDEESTKQQTAKAEDSLSPEQQQKQLMLDQWLRQIPDDPAELLRNKFMLEHLRRQRQSSPR